MVFSKLYEGLIYLFRSFDNTKEGASARKLSAFSGLVMALYLSIKHTTSQNIEAILITWLSFSALCLGIITVEQIIKFKQGNV